MSGPLRDLVHAWRGLRQSPIFLVAALATIGIGIGANVTVFSIVNGISLRPMPFGDRTDRLITIHPTHRLATDEPSWGDSEISYRDLVDYRGAGSVEGLGGYMIRNFVLSGDASSAERVVGGSVTPELFQLLGVDPILGRHFLPEEAAAPGLETSVMLTHNLWQRRYAGDPSIIGKTDHHQRRRPHGGGCAAAAIPVPGTRSALHAACAGTSRRARRATSTPSR